MIDEEMDLWDSQKETAEEYNKRYRAWRDNAKNNTQRSDTETRQDN